MCSPLLFTFLSFACLWWVPVDTIYLIQGSYYTGPRIAWKLKMLADELVQDAVGKVDAIQHYRDQYYRSLQFQLGDMMYDIRYLFRQMVLLFQRTDKMLAYNHLDHNENIRRHSNIVRLGMEIENKVIMLQSWQQQTETKQAKVERMNSPLRSGFSANDDEVEEPLAELVVRGRLRAREAQARAQAPRGGARGRAQAPRGGTRGRAPAARDNRHWRWRHVGDADFHSGR